MVDLLTLGIGLIALYIALYIAILVGVPTLVYKFTQKKDWKTSLKFAGIYLVFGFIFGLILILLLKMTLFASILGFATPFLAAWIIPKVFKKYTIKSIWKFGIMMIVAQLIAGVVLIAGVLGLAYTDALTPMSMLGGLL